MSSTPYKDAKKEKEIKSAKRRKHVSVKYEDGVDKEEVKQSIPRRKYVETIHLIREMRKDRNAIVDQLGAEQIPQGEGKVFRFQCLVSVMLSSMTKDEQTAAAVRRLQTLLPNGLNISSVLSSSEEQLAGLLRGVGFHNRKAKYLLETAEILQNQYQGDIPRTLEDLLQLPGIGSKMGKITMDTAWGEIVGIAADTHVHRICNRIGWTRSGTPLETERQLEGWLPKEYWKDMNLLLVGFGQQICSAKLPQCHKCALDGMCPKINLLQTKKESNSNK